MTIERVLDPVYPVSELVKRYSRTHEAAHSDLNIFNVDGEKTNIKGILMAFCEDIEIEMSMSKEKGGTGKAEEVVEKVIPRFFRHFLGQTLSETCTLLNYYGGYLSEVYNFDEDAQREMIRLSTVNEIALATNALKRPDLESGILNAWAHVKASAEEFLPKITASKSLPAKDMARV